MIDTESTHTILQNTIVSVKYYTPATQIAEVRQMDRKFYKYDTSVKDVYFYF